MDANAKIPTHVAIIMDGNGRWAEHRGLPRVQGHQAGAESVRAVVRACKELGVRYLTLYAFSVENWIRPEEEITGLMALLESYLRDHEYELHENQVRFRAIGRLSDLPEPVQEELQRVMDATRDYASGELILALSYGGRAEITDAVRKIAAKIKSGEVGLEEIDEALIAKHLYAPDVPDPDLMIRTSGEMRISNFLLWELSYAELYVTDIYWPDFREEQFMEALREYQRRQRRFGDIR